MRTFFLIVGILASSEAQAECLQWGRTLNGGVRVCMMDDVVNHNPVIPEGPCSSVGGCNGTALTTVVVPKCDDGWTLVADLTMHPMCARELKAPK